jgi:hypothetical protein
LRRRHPPEHARAVLNDDRRTRWGRAATETDESPTTREPIATSPRSARSSRFSPAIRRRSVRLSEEPVVPAGFEHTAPHGCPFALALTDL